MWGIEKGSVYVINLGELEDKIWNYCIEYKKKYGDNWEETHPEKIDDLGSIKLAKKIAQKIEEELKYPGEIKVNVIRETRVVDYAR